MSIFKRVIGRAVRALPEVQYTTPVQLHSGDKRIYHVHIRKTAGTSLNHILMGVSGGDDHSIYKKVASSWTHSSVVNRFKYAGYDRRVINRGNYFYAYSHLPYWQLDLPKETYKFTCFRDPVDRVLSHYKMLDDLRASGQRHPCMAVEGRWLGDNIHDFIDNIPRPHLLNQLYMFSKEMNVTEACYAISKMDEVLFTRDLSDGLSRMSNTLGICLEYQHRRKSTTRSFDSDVVARLRDELDDEYRLLDNIAANKVAR